MKHQTRDMREIDKRSTYLSCEILIDNRIGSLPASLTSDVDNQGIRLGDEQLNIRATPIRV